jgi:hypothetical protein
LLPSPENWALQLAKLTELTVPAKKLKKLQSCNFEKFLPVEKKR